MRFPPNWRHGTALFILPLLAVDPTIAQPRPNQAERVPFTEVRVTQGVGASAFAQLAANTSDQFKQALPSVCRPDERVVAPVIGALSGIVIDWLFGRMMESLDRRLQARIKAHTATYGHDPLYGILEEPRWRNEQSCVFVQRIECTVTPAQALAEGTRCSNGSPMVSLALLLANKQSHLLALPAVFEVTQLKPLHAGGKASAGVSLRLDSLTFNAEDGGDKWSSGEAVILAEAFNAEAARRGVKAKATHFSTTPTDDAAWANALRLPMVPLLPNDSHASTAALRVTIAEVGATPRGLEDFAAFMSAKKDDLAGALSAAVKKKLHLGE
jgi:hypothetical protein